MKVLQNIKDWFYMKIGKTEKVFPVTVEKHRLQGQTEEGDYNIKLDGIDHGRTLIDDEGNKKFDLMNEPQATGLVNYEDFNQDLGTRKYVSVLMVDRENFVPLTRNYNFDENYQESGVSELEYCLQTPRMKEMAINQFEEDAKIVETQNNKWWEQPKFQAAILFISAGLFFIFLAYGQGQFFIQEQTEAMQQLSDQIGSLQNSLNSESLG